MIPDNGVALAFTSPPYNVGKDYDDDIGLKEYLDLIRSVASEVYRVLRPGGRYVINIANLGRRPYIPLHAFFYDIHTDAGFLPMGEIIWQKARGASASCAWGSWKSARSPRLRDIHEYLLVFAKQSFSRPDNGLSDIERNEFLDATLSIWEIPPESAKRVGHPAPFPVELAERVVKLYSYVGDVVLDPFVGSGSTCIAAVRTKRHYVGFDVSEEYCELAKLSIAEEREEILFGHRSQQRRTSMARSKTESSELAVAFGILEIEDPTNLSNSDITQLFEGTLSPAKYARFRNEFVSTSNEALYKKMYSVGKKLRSNYLLFMNVDRLKWTGAEKQAATTSASIDLRVANIPVSIKADSNVVRNASAHNLFISVPSGSALADYSENWFMRMDPDGYQELYSIVRKAGLENLPLEVGEFEKTASSTNRRAVQMAEGQLPDAIKSAFQTSYVAMCHRVAQKSADLFNENILVALAGNSRNTVLENIARLFFRMDSVEYIFAGLDRGVEFGVAIPELSQWKRDWKITKVEASPNLKRQQSVVDIAIAFVSKSSSGTTGSAQFHVEIRWSHGKFRQNPEAKLYKDFRWQDILFLSSLW